MISRLRRGAHAESPAENVGEEARGIGERVGVALQRLPARTMAGLDERIQELAWERHLVYVRAGVPEPVRVLPWPITVLREQLGYLHFVALTIQNALKRLPDVYLADPDARALLELSPEEEDWLRDWGPSHREHGLIFGRLDAIAELDSPGWRESLRFIEPNLSGIGGLHKGPSCERILEEVLAPVLAEIDPDLRLERGPDIRELLTQEVLDHLQAIGRRGGHLCLVEPKYEQEGPDEQGALARYVQDRYGIEVVHADPSELSLRGGEVWHRDVRVDIAYRDYAVADLVLLEREGIDVEPMRALMRDNRMISSLAAELDQKSCWELLTDPVLACRHFSAEERQVFRRHVLWTRLLTERKTTLVGGQVGDLVEFTRRERASLVLKPNRSYGGEGVLLGDEATPSEWDAGIERALAGGLERAPLDRWVVQERATAGARELPGAGGARGERFFIVLGFAPSRHGTAILARASTEPIVNLARGGGMCGVLVGHAAARAAVRPWSSVVARRGSRGRAPRRSPLR